MAAEIQDWMQEAADEIMEKFSPLYGFGHELTQIIAAHAPGWVSVEENGLPPVGRWVWVVCNGVVQRYAAFFTGLVWEWADRDADSAPQDVVTDWQPIQMPPRRGTK